MRLAPWSHLRVGERLALRGRLRQCQTDDRIGRHSTILISPINPEKHRRPPDLLVGTIAFFAFFNMSSPPIRSSFLFLPLPRHPLLDIRRAVQHRDTFVLAGIEEPNCFDVHEVDLLQIQRDRLSTADLGLYLIEMVRSKLSAQPKSNFA